MKNKTNTAFLFINLGTPETLTLSSIRKYLKEFLMDPRVIDLPYILRFLIVYGFILPFRPKKTIQKYRIIWDNITNQSPLISYTEQFINKVKLHLSEYNIDYAMRYGKPSIQDKMNEIYNKGIRYLHIIPLYPQYATSTYGTVIAEICRINQKYWDPLLLSFEEIYNNNENFIELWVNKIQAIKNYKNYYILFSFHGIPERHIIKSDRLGNCFKDNCCDNVPEYCYRAQTQYISKRIATTLQLKHYGIAYQSRLGKAKWLEPYLEEHLKEIIKYHNKIIIVPISFTMDCLETLEELKVSTKEFILKYNSDLEYIVLDALNAEESWINFWVNKIRNFF
ncbi:MAG: ferrochelatase [Leptospiraceae bacterium]|nr:MAG: ferrochelatase [Leptospiraceae bacterium]